MKSLLVVAWVILLGSFANGIQLNSNHEINFRNLGGSEKALSHFKCFAQSYSRDSFELKSSTMAARCNGLQSGRRAWIENQDFAVIVDYSLPSNQRRFFIFDLNDSNGGVTALYVSHGRNGSTPHNNSRLSPGKNSVLKVEYYSNILGSNASSPGFYITGHTYQGRWVGPRGDKFSLILHGVSRDQNDNACQRLVVVHGNRFIKESGPNEGVRLMSSGCFMLDYDIVNDVVEAIRGGGGDNYPSEAKVGGTLFYAYGGDEMNLPENFYCTSEAQGQLRTY